MTDLQDHAGAFPYARTCAYDPPEQFARWHAQGPLTRITLWNGEQAWLATGAEEVRAVMRDPRTYSSDPAMAGFPTLSEADKASKGASLLPMLDPPLHDVLRRAVMREFTVRRVEETRVATEVIVRDLLDAMAAMAPPIDMIPVYAAAVPAQFTCRLLGVPLSDGDFFAACLSDRFDPSAATASVYTADGNLTSYFAGVVADRKRSPRDDLSGRLVTDHVLTGAIDDEQAAKLLHVLLIGGFDTTRNMIAMSTIWFSENRDRLAHLQADPALWGPAVEELLRFMSVAQYERRAVTTDTVLAGQQLHAGEGVLTVLHAANRDPRAFARADEVVFDRSDNNHVAFGYGIHQCLGQPVARMMLRLALPALFTRFPDLELVVPKEELTYYEGRTIWGPTTLPVTWAP